MFGRKPEMSPLALRKRLLIAESELNRAQLSADCEAMARGVHDLARRAQGVADWAAAAGLLIAAVRVCRRAPPPPVAANPSWLQKILNCARIASTLWFALRPRRE